MKISSHLNEAEPSFADKLAKAIGQYKEVMTNTKTGHNKYYIIEIKPMGGKFNVMGHFGSLKNVNFKSIIANPETAKSEDDKGTFDTFEEARDKFNEIVKQKLSKTKKYEKYTF